MCVCGGGWGWGCFCTSLFLARNSGRITWVFLCVQTMVWLPVLGIFNMRTDVDACDGTQGLYGRRKRVCTGNWFWEKNPFLHRGLALASVLCLAFQQIELLPSSCSFWTWCQCSCCSVLGDTGGVVNSLDFCPASLKSLGCFYFLCVLSSQWKAVTVNLGILHCQL